MHFQQILLWCHESYEQGLDCFGISSDSTTIRRHLFLTSIRTTPEGLLRLIRQRWSIENEWHWARDAQCSASTPLAAWRQSSWAS
jgi:predicted transposase YbfD/YdcC